MPKLGAAVSGIQMAVVQVFSLRVMKARSQRSAVARRRYYLIRGSASRGLRGKAAQMKLIKTQLRRYRSIEDGGDFDVEPDVTCLVGKNESGKTAVLQAMYKSHAVDKAKFDIGLDYPSRLTREKRGSDAITVSILTYELDDHDVHAAEEEFGKGVLSSRRFSVTAGYRFKATTWEVEVDESAVVSHLRKGLDLPSATQQLVDKSDSVEALVEALQSMEAPTSSVTAVISKVSSWRKQDLDLAVIDVLSARRPKFVYFGDYDSMPGKVSIPHLIEARDEGDLTRGEEAVLALLSMAGVAPEDFHEPESHEHLIRDLENASNSTLPSSLGSHRRGRVTAELHTHVR